MSKKHTHISQVDQPHYVVPKFQKPEVGKSPPGGFSPFFNRVFDGYVSQIGDMALRCYLALLRKSRAADAFQVEMGHGELCDRLDISLASVKRGIGDLCELGLIVVLKAGGSDVAGNRYKTVYQLMVPTPAPETAIPGSVETPVIGLDRDQQRTRFSEQTGVMDEPSQASDPGLARPCNTYNTQTMTTDDPAITAAVALLVERKLKTKDAESLVEKYGPANVMPAVILVDQTQAKGKVKTSYRGLLVRAIENGWGPAEKDHKRTTKPKPSAEDKERKKEQAEARKIQSEFDDAKGIVDRIKDDVELETHKMAAIEAFVDKDLHYLYLKSNPRKSATLVPIVAKYLKERVLPEVK